jgi:hypothetical protein
MALGVEGMRARRVVGKVVLLTLSTLGFVASLTLLYQSMRAVMDVGGACASGGAYQINTPCPDGVAWAAPVSIFGMLIFGALGSLGVFSQGGPKPYVFTWSALFLALGWNFLEYGFDAPNGGTSAGWLVCGFVFVAMGGLPLLILFGKGAARWAFWGPRREAPEGGPVPYRPPPDADAVVDVDKAEVLHPVDVIDPTAGAAGGLMSPPRTWTPAPPSTPGPAPEPDEPDMVTRLERLADLRERGMLDADEYEVAKDRILDDGKDS